MQLLVPLVCALSKTVNRLVELANVVGRVLGESFRLSHVDLLVHVAVEKSMRDVDGMEVEIVLASDSEEKSNGCQLAVGAKTSVKSRPGR